jgi:hypothetical protein
VGYLVNAVVSGSAPDRLRGYTAIEAVRAGLDPNGTTAKSSS